MSMPWSEFAHIPQHLVSLKLCKPCPFNLFMAKGHIHTRCDQNVPRLIFLLGCGYTSGHPCLQVGVLKLLLSLGQGMVPGCLSVLCELWSKRVMYLCLVIVRAMRDVGRARAAGVHQILCETGKKCCGDI